VSASSDQVNQWLALLTLNLLVMSSILMEMLMAEEINKPTPLTLSRSHGETTASRGMDKALYRRSDWQRPVVGAENP